MKTQTALLSLAVLCASLITSLPAKADTYFRDNDRVILRTYVTTTTTTTPTTTTTTTPTSQTVTYYTPGTEIPSTVTYTTLPTTVTTKLAPAPQGAEYVLIGGNAYLIDHDKRVVIDAEKLDD